MKKETFPVDILVDTRADRASYMSLAFYHMMAKWARLVASVRKDGKGILNAAAPPSNNPTPLSPIRILRTSLLPLKSPSETWVKKITFRIVDGLPYGLMVGADYLPLTVHKAPELTKLQAAPYVGVRYTWPLELARETELRWKNPLFLLKLKACAGQRGTLFERLDWKTPGLMHTREPITVIT